MDPAGHDGRTGGRRRVAARRVGHPRRGAGDPHRGAVPRRRHRPGLRAGGRPARRGAQLGHGVPGPVQPLAPGLRGPAAWRSSRRGRQVTARALNQRGAVLLPVLARRRAGPGRCSCRRGVGPGRGERGRSPSRPGCSPRRSAAGGPRCSPRCARSSPRSRATTRTSACTARSATTWRSSSSRSRRASTGPTASATWSCTCPTSCSWWTASGRPRCATPTSSPWTACPPRGLPTGHAGVRRRAGAGHGERSPARTRARRLRADRRAGQGAFRPRRPVRGGAQPGVPRAVRLGRRVLPAAAAAQPGAVRVLLQPGRGGVPGRRVAGDVRAGDRGPGRDLPDLRHDRARHRRAGGRGEHPHAAQLGQGRVRADHVHRRGPQRQVAGLRAGQRPGDRAAADRDVQPADPHRRPRRGPAAARASTRWTRSSPTCGR